MDLSYGAEYDAFREEVRSFIRENKDKQPQAGDGIKSQAMRDWQALLIENGYHSRTIPSEYGGFGAEPDIIKSRIIAEEFGAERMHRGFNGQGVTMLTPVLLEMGTEEQKKAFVEPTIRAEMICARVIPSPVQEVIWRASPLKLSLMGMNGSSTDRKSGPVQPITLTGSFASFAPNPMHLST